MRREKLSKKELNVTISFVTMDGEKVDIDPDQYFDLMTPKRRKEQIALFYQAATGKRYRPATSDDES